MDFDVTIDERFVCKRTIFRSYCIFIYLIVQDMPQLFNETTTMKQYGVVVFRLVIVFLLFNFGLTSSKNYVRSKQRAN